MQTHYFVNVQKQVCFTALEPLTTGFYRGGWYLEVLYHAPSFENCYP